MEKILSNEVVVTESASNLPSPNSYNYPNSLTLKNKYGITNHKDFINKCAHDTAKAAINLRQEKPPEKFDSSYLKYLHKELFKKTFEWAGHTREIPFSFEDGTVGIMPEMMRSNWKTDQPIVFAIGNKVQDGLKNIDRIIIKNNNLQSLSRKEFIHNMAEIFSLLNYTHPFREGNGRTQRLFCEKLAQVANYYLDFSVVTKERMSYASIAAAQDSNLEPMKKLFDDISNPEKTAVLKECMKNIKNIDHKNINDCIIVAADKGFTYTGTYKGDSPDSIILKTGDNIYSIFSKDNCTPEQLKVLKIGDDCILTVPIKKNVEDTLIPKEKIPPLTKSAITENIQKDALIQQNLTQITYLSKLVYGSSKALSNQISLINTNPKAGEQLSRQIMLSPQSISKLAGIKILGVKNSMRKKAEDNVIKLANSVENYMSSVKNAETTILQQHQLEQKRCQKMVKPPSEELKNILNLPEEKRKEVLLEGKFSASIAKELTELINALNARLSPNERKMVKENDKNFAKSVGISETKAEIIIKITQEAKKVYQQMQKLTVDIAKNSIVSG
ncbi:MULTISPECIES: BID domain-containing T4SS effector [unclassified Bartonella]|uniref:BID domain-containing T4SS effector n=1 Tax=unclassified Bartonella TaxID=2645622 RepID=UPI0009995D5F|nr:MULTISPECIES: BID domain-containing T4SS effector [unclassified Bartonella]AQX28656.1 Bartonella effector protein Bep1 [Bartonella sp. JB15]AQX29911.1 Bartonella effector protein Bep1 [Bartonella sp. JB63]